MMHMSFGRYSLMEFRHWEVEFWSAFDRNLAQCADLRVTVSPQLADVMAQEYGCDFITVPNCVSRSSVPSLDDLDAALQRFANREHVSCLSSSAVFNAGRGIEDLITAWAACRSAAHCFFCRGRTTHSSRKMLELARSKGMLDEPYFLSRRRSKPRN